MKNYSALFYKLQQYSALSVPLITISNALHAQVIYTDVKPDFKGRKSGDTFKLDLNHDSIIDYTIFLASDTANYQGHDSPFISRSLVLRAYNSNGAAASTFRTSRAFPNNTYMTLGLPGAYPCDSLIDSHDVSFLSFQFQVLWLSLGFESAGQKTFGRFKNAFDQSVGLKFAINGKPHYGWVRLDTKTNQDTIEFTVKDYAYLVDTADYFSGIVTCDTAGTATGVQALNQNRINIVEFEKQVFISSTLNKKMDINITDLSGRTIEAYTTNKNSFHFSLNNFPYGLYMITVEQAGQRTTKKVSLR